MPYGEIALVLGVERATAAALVRSARGALSRACARGRDAPHRWSEVSAAYRDALGLERAPCSGRRALRVARAESNMR